MLRSIQKLAWRARRGKILLWTALTQIVLVNLLMLIGAPLLFAHDCSPKRAEDCLRSDGYAQGLSTLVGVIGTVLVNGVAIVTLILTPRQPIPATQDSSGGNQPPEPDKQYFLNLLTEGSRTLLKPDGQDLLWVYAQVTCSDPKVDTAPLTAAVGFQAAGPNARWLQFSGEALRDGYKAVCVQATPVDQGLPQPGGASVMAGVMIEGKSVSGGVDLQLDEQVDFVAWVDGSPSGRYDRNDKSWHFPRLVCYFRGPSENTPVRPSFSYKFASPSFVTDKPDLLTLTEGFSNNDGLSWQFEVKGADPEVYNRVFGPDLDQNGGKFDVTFTVVEDETQKPWHATTKLSVAPEAVMMAYSYDEPSGSGPARTGFGQFEFAADGEDTLHVAVIFVRSDKIDPSKKASDYYPDAVLGCVRVDEISLTGLAADKFTLEGDVPKDGISIGPALIWKLKIKANDPLVAVPENQHLKLDLFVRGAVAGPSAPSFANTDLHAIQALSPLPVLLKMVVVPSTNRMKSDAYARVGVASAGGFKPLPRTQVKFAVVSTGSSGQLAIEGPDEMATDPTGVAICPLAYSGLEWKTVGDAKFKVRCGVKFGGDDPEKATYAEIDVGANLAGYLDQLCQHADALELSNPFWKANKSALMGTVCDWMWPNSLTGPLNNICRWTGIKAAGPSLDYYVCQKLCDRIVEFSAKQRRFSADLATAASMNGLEFDTYVISPIHVIAGLTLSGTEDPYFIDPWWDQWFNKDKVMLTYADEVTRLGACVALLLSGFAAVALVAIGAVGTLPAAGTVLLEWLGGLGGVVIPNLARATNAVTCTFGFGLTFYMGKVKSMPNYSEGAERWGTQFLTQPPPTGTISPVEDW